MAQLLCKSVEDGLRDAEATVTIEEHDKTPQYLPVDRGMLHKKGKDYYLSVRLLLVDKESDAALVSLPVEADSGANRIWVKLADVLNDETVS
jgi:hypothetical protein